MALRALVFLANAFVVGYALDGAFSLLEVLFRTFTGSGALMPARNVLAGAVVGAAPILLLAMAATPRLPPSVIAPLAVSALWMGFGAAPLAFSLEGSTLERVLIALQLAISALVSLRIRRFCGGRSWLLGRETPPRPSHSLAYSFKAAVVLALAGFAALLVYLPLWLLLAVQQTTGGFVRFDNAGVSLGDHHFQRDGQEVRLVGMMHIGEGEAYQELIESFSGSSTVVLEEGVTDRENRLLVPFSYENAARALGLDTQNPIEVYLDETEAPEGFERPDLRHADVDLAEFHPDSITVLGWSAEVWTGEDPIGAFIELYRRYEEEPERWAVFTEDVLTRRNVHLLEQVKQALAEYDRVIVPWGALHLPFIQYHVLEMGFEPTSRTSHPLFSWATIGSALLAAGSPTDLGSDPERAPDE